MGKLLRVLKVERLNDNQKVEMVIDKSLTELCSLFNDRYIENNDSILTSSEQYVQGKVR